MAALAMGTRLVGRRYSGASNGNHPSPLRISIVSIFSRCWTTASAAMLIWILFSAPTFALDLPYNQILDTSANSNGALQQIAALMDPGSCRQQPMWNGTRRLARCRSWRCLGPCETKISHGWGPCQFHALVVPGLQVWHQLPVGLRCQCELVGRRGE